MNLGSVLRLLGRLLGLLAVAQLLPVVVSLWYGERNGAIAFAVSAAITGAVGIVCSRFPPAERLYRREGILIVVGGWFLASIFGALPFVLSGEIPSPVDAVFEAASGFTTTGASILTDIESHGRGMLFWRSFTQWLGGLGIIVLFVALLSELGAGTRFLYKMEVPGPTTEIMHPRVHETAVVLLKIYVLLTFAETALLLIAGMGLYDALTHTFSTMSTGGFSPRAASVAAFSSPAIHIIIIVFMTLAGMNFSLFYALRHGKWKLWRDRELVVYLGLIAVTVGLITWDLRVNHELGGGRALLESAFQIVSLMTTTGFATADFDLWPGASKALLILVMLLGGCAGSTAGGVKVMRGLIALKTAFREVRLIFSPNAIIPITIRGVPVPESAARSVSGFLTLYAFTLVVGSVLLAIGGADLVTAATASLACLGNIGPGLSAVGPTQNFAFFDAWEKLLLVLLMWLGRLEVLAIMAVATRAFWRR